jgi:predicted RNA-binding Zn ribbon-like protein
MTVTNVTEPAVTGQVHLDSYADAGVLVAVDLVNALAGAPDVPAGLPDIAAVVAIDPPSVAQLDAADVPGFVALAQRLREIFADLDHGDLDAAASRLNELLAQHPATPHLAKEAGQWRLHHHPVDASLVPMWTSICAEGVARLVGSGNGERFGTCERPGCGRVFLDLSKNASRRFCSTTCQNRVKTAAYRRRRGPGNDNRDRD